MSYPLLLILHLLAAIAFVGTVFFEVFLLGGIHGKVSEPSLVKVENALGIRARGIMPWVLLVLYGAGIGLAWHYRGALAEPLTSSFAALLSLKILLAVSVFGHFVTAMLLQRRGLLSGERSRKLHISIFCHVVLIVVLAKGMFFIRW
ncbi:MAG: hypothetical protein WC997_08265 [Porticoccaceae bacterium]